MIRAAIFSAMLLAVVAPLPAQATGTDEKLAESRLRGCLLAGASAAPTTGLAQAIPAVRAFCAPQIGKLERYRVAAATAGLSGDAARAAEDAAVRALNDEIARAIATFTGLTA